MSQVNSILLTDGRRRRQIVGACVVSAAGSLPQHLMPFMVALAAGEGLLPVERAGWISSCFVVGVLLVTVGLPLLGIRRITRVWPLVATVTLWIVLWIGTFHGPRFLLASWIVVGAACGLMHLLGTTSAASYSDRHFVFGLRLALVLCAAATVIGGAAAFGGFHSYGLAATVLTVGFATICCVGLLWYQPPSSNIIVSPIAAKSPTPPAGWGSLAMVLLVFAGQPGFAAYSAHIAMSHGIAAVDLAPTYAVSKLVSASVLMKWGASVRVGPPTLTASAVLCASIVAMASAPYLAAFAVGLVLWEVCVNVQSTRLQATIVSENPLLGGLWLPAAIACGAGIGPAIHGELLAHRAGQWFIGYSVFSGLLPAAWMLCRSRIRAGRASL